MVIGCRGSDGSAPLRDRGGTGDRQPPLADQDSDEGVDHRLGHRPREHRRVGAVARRVALGHDPPLVHHHHRLGSARRSLRRLGEGALDGGPERGARRLRRRQLRAGRRDRAPRRGCRRRGGGRAGEHHRAPDAVVVRGLHREAAEQRGADGAPAPVHLVAQPRAEEAHARRGGHRLDEGAVGIEPRDEGLGAEHVAHQPGGHAHRGVGPPRQDGDDRAHGQQRGEDQGQPAQHGVSGNRAGRCRRAVSRGRWRRPSAGGRRRSRPATRAPAPPPPSRTSRASPPACAARARPAAGSWRRWRGSPR